MPSSLALEAIVKKNLYDKFISFANHSYDSWYLAAKYGRLEMIIWLNDNKEEYKIKGGNNWVINYASEHGHLEVIKWLYHKGYGFTSYAINIAAENGHLETVKWLHEHRKIHCDEDDRNYEYAMNWASHNGHLDIVIWLHEHGYNCTKSAMDWAAEQGHLEIVKWLHEHRKEGCSTSAMTGAAEKGKLDVVKFLYKNRIDDCCLSDALDWACAGKQYQVICWLTLQLTKNNI
jgi:ankyrin repeat protein